MKILISFIPGYKCEFLRRMKSRIFMNIKIYEKKVHSHNWWSRWGSWSCYYASHRRSQSSSAPPWEFLLLLLNPLPHILGKELTARIVTFCLNSGLMSEFKRITKAVTITITFVILQCVCSVLSKSIGLLRRLKHYWHTSNYTQNFPYTRTFWNIWMNQTMTWF